MNLIVDLGNTRVKCGVFDGDNQLVFLEKTAKRSASVLVKSVIERFDITHAILSHTSKPSESLLAILEAIPYFIHFDHSTAIPVFNDYETPTTLGKDRLAGAVRAYALFPEENVLVIDMGTCITMNLVHAEGRFKGGNISPGISMRLRAMNAFTDGLPLVPIEVPSTLYGLNTIQALQNGAVKGAFWEIETFIKESEAELGKICVVLTGGDAIYFENWTKYKIFAAPNLVLEGLNEILNYNAEKV